MQGDNSQQSLREQLNNSRAIRSDQHSLPAVYKAG